MTELKQETKRPLTEIETKNLIQKYGLPLPKKDVAKTADEAAEKAKAIGYPVVMKIISPDIIHKTDVGGVILNISDDESAREAFNTIIENVKSRKPDAKIEGVLVEEMVKSGHEVIIGGLRDNVFGPVVMFGGVGGIYVELFQDVSFRLAPLDKATALEMIKETKGYKILQGYRGIPPSDIDGLADLLVKVSEIMDEHPEILELDLNPVRVFSNRVVILDAKGIVRA
ncbi:MAG: acetate--CoA ligase family protein [Candidatus Njordarchaeia archaeon]